MIRYKDTVMDMEKRTFYKEKCHKLINTYHQENPDFDQKLVERSLDDKAIQICQDVALEELEDQAEISFKAGQQNGLSLEMQGEAYCQGVLVGIKKVVDTTIYLALANGNISIRELFELHPEGQAQLKVWGLEL